MAQYFAEQALASEEAAKQRTHVCQRAVTRSNEPLGTRHAGRIARALGIDQEMILTDCREVSDAAVRRWATSNREKAAASGVLVHVDVRRNSLPRN